MRKFSFLGLAAFAHADPIAEVVSILKKTKTELAEEEEKDVSHMKKWGCYYKESKEQIEKDLEENDRLRNQAADAIAAATTAIEENTKAAANKKDKLTETTDSLQEANGSEQERARNFLQKKKEYTQAITALKNAQTVLKKHQSFLQKDGLKKVAKTLSAAAHLSSGSSGKRLRAFIQNPEAAQYKAKSTTIFSLLEEFEADISEQLAELEKGNTVKKDAHQINVEGKAQEQAALTQDIADANQLVKEANVQQAENEVVKAQNDELFKNNSEALANLEAENTRKLTERDDRLQKRNLERQAIDKATEILTSDEAFANRQASFGMFMQVSRLSKKHVYLKAMNAQRQVRIQKTRAGDVGATFAKITDKITERINAIHVEKEGLNADHQHCQDRILDHEKQIANIEQDIKVNEQTLMELESEKARMNEEFEAASTEVDANQKKIANLGTIRKEEHDDAVKAIANNEQTVKILAEANAALKAVFENGAVMEDGSVGVFMQQAPVEGEAQSNSQNQSGRVVIDLLNRISSETTAKIGAIQTEMAASQKAYETAMRDLNKLNKNLNSEMNSLTSSLASNAEKIDSTTEEKASNEELLKSENEAHEQTQKDCYFILNNRDSMREHAETEVAALESAHQFLTKQAENIMASQAQVANAGQGE